MKKMSSVFGLCLLALSGVAGAQTCTSPKNLNSANSFSGDTCTGTNEAGTLCGTITANEKDNFFAVTLGATHTNTISLTNTAAAHVPAETFTPAMVLYTGTCANGGPATGCTANVEAATGADAALDITGAPAGTYFLDVTSLPGNGVTDCGQYTLAYAGVLPVKLIKFSAE